MKKIVAFSVLLALLTAAVFAQDDNGSGWKIGFSAQLARNFFYTTKATGEGEVKITDTTPGALSIPTIKLKLGDYTKGSTNLWTYTPNTYGWAQHDNRVLLSISNNAEHHSVYFDVAIDDSWVGDGFSLQDFLSNGNADWWFSADTGASGAPLVLDAKIGTGGYNGFVPVYEIWDDYIQGGYYNFFGVVRNDGFLPSNNISAADMAAGNPWSSVYALGLTFKDSFRLALGSTLGSFSSGPNDPLASASAVEAGFMLSGKNVAELLSFDVFYAIKGEDNNTGSREIDGSVAGGKWENIIGAYVGVDLGKFVKGLGVSVGYTANFTASEKGQIDVADHSNPLVIAPKWETYDTTNPVWSGIDINVNFSGVEKLGITFANNLSFAAAKASETKGNFDTDTRIIGLDGNRINHWNDTTNPLSLNNNDKYDVNQSWFAYKASLGVSYAITDRLSATLGLRNLLTVYTVDNKSVVDVLGTKLTKTEKSSNTTDDLIASLHADYNVGNVTFGIGLTLGVASFSIDSETKSSSIFTTTTTTKGGFNTTTFAVPLFFKVAF